MCDQGGKKKATTDAVSIKQPRCQEKAIFKFGFPFSIADFPKENHSSSSRNEVDLLPFYSTSPVEYNGRSTQLTVCWPVRFGTCKVRRLKRA